MSGFTEAQLTDWKVAAEEMVNGEIVERLIAEIERLRGARTEGYRAGVLAGREQAAAECDKLLREAYRDGSPYSRGSVDGAKQCRDAIRDLPAP